MADAVTTVILDDHSTYQQTRLRAHLTCISDGTGETGVLKLNPANYNSYTQPGKTPVAAIGFQIEYIRWNIQTFKYVELMADTTLGTVMMVLSGNGFEGFGTSPADGALPEYSRPVGLPGGLTGTAGAGGGTGGIKFTTVGALVGASYDITMKVFLVPAGSV